MTGPVTACPPDRYLDASGRAMQDTRDSDIRHAAPVAAVRAPSSPDSKKEE